MRSRVRRVRTRWPGEGRPRRGSSGWMARLVAERRAEPGLALLGARRTTRRGRCPTKACSAGTRACAAWSSEPADWLDRLGRVGRGRVCVSELAWLRAVAGRLLAGRFVRGAGLEGARSSRAAPPRPGGRLGRRGAAASRSTGRRPAGVDRLLAGLARVLDPRAAVRAAQVAALDRVRAIRARLLLELPHAQLGGPDLQLALLGVLEELRRAQDRVDDRAHVREQRGPGGAGDQDRVLDPAAGVEEGPGDQRDPDDHQEQHHEIHEQVQAAVRDAEER